MNNRCFDRAPGRLRAALAILTAVAAMGSSTVHAQFLPETFFIDSFESGVTNWTPETANTVYLNHAASTTGATNGSGSMLLDLYGSHQRNPENPVAGVSGWGVSRFVDTTDTSGLYAAFNAVAANPSAWNLHYDVTTDATSWANITTPTGPPLPTAGGWSFLNLGFNNGSGFSQVGNVSPNIVNQQGRFQIRVPMEQLNWQVDSPSYQFLLGAFNRFVPQPGTTPGPPPAGTAAKYYIDNIRFKPKAPLVGTTLFSWETPDNPATTGVNEAFENWSDAGLNTPTATDPNDAYAHKHSVQTVGATQGTRALTIDTTISDPGYVNPLGLPQSYGFHWASNMVLDADTNPDPAIEVIDPVIQADITDKINKINKGLAIAFDVSFSDPLTTGEFPTSALPGFLGFEVHISDDRGSFFQAPATTFDGATIATLLTTDDPSEPRVVSVPLTQFVDLGGSALGTLSAAKLLATSSFLRIGVSVNANGPAVIRMDNFRVITEVSLDADFDNDGDVDAADLPVWRTAMTANTANGDANDDGVTNGADFLIWQRQLGNDATPGVASVPEPGTALLVACGLAAAAGARRRNRLSR